MKVIALASIATGAAAMQTEFVAKYNLDDVTHSLSERFTMFKGQFNKGYTAAEEITARKVFAWHDAKIQAFNAKNTGVTLGHNEFSDVTEEAFFATHTTNIAPRKDESNVNMALLNATRVAAGAAKDWVALGAVTPVKNQQQCGSCWAFSTTGSFEGAYQLAGNPLTAFSEQFLLDCDTVDQACNGGLMDNAFKQIKALGGLPTEGSYPYTEKKGTCKKTISQVATLAAFTDVPTKSETGLVAALDIGPVSIAVEADKSVFQSYKSGVITSALCGTKLDHGVLAVGYGTDAGTDYYKVKNSWGATWGVEGYLKIERGHNTCGIETDPSYPTGVTKTGNPPGPSPPAPGPSPGPGPAPGGACSPCYENPPACSGTETKVQITGVAGDFCSPVCTGNTCPAGDGSFTARPSCVLETQGSPTPTQCALICVPGDDAACPAGASCQAIQGEGVCTYPVRR